MAILVVCASCNNGLEGPERERFTEIHRLTVSVETGDVLVFGSERTDGVVLDRWHSGEHTFQRLEERNTAGELFIDAVCHGDRSCRARYEMGAEASTDVEVEVGAGAVELIGLEGEVQVAVGSGQLRAVSLVAPFVDAAIEEGTARLSFAEAPGELVVRVGEEASATVIVPDQPYRCNFDRDADSIGSGQLDCAASAASTLRVEPSNGSVRFAVDDH